MTEIPLGRRRPPRCPICGATPASRFHPFCSARCADVDLNRWLTGVYAIPAAENQDEEQEEGEGRE